MYTPGFNQVSRRDILIEAMRAWSFAILVGPETARPFEATHLPLVVKDEGPHGVLEGHFARANRHWQALAGHPVLAIFSGPHGYISPSLYVDPLSVPTWNYIAVHAYGVLELVEDEAAKETLLAEMIHTYEPAYWEKWRAMPVDFRRPMLAEIVGFRISIQRIEGKFKLSQNRDSIERDHVQAAYAAGTADQQALAAWMARIAG